MDLTWLGYLHLVVTVAMAMLMSSMVGLRTRPRLITWWNVAGYLVLATLWFWGYATVGVVH